MRGWRVPPLLADLLGSAILVTGGVWLWMILVEPRLRSALDYLKLSAAIAGAFVILAFLDRGLPRLRPWARNLVSMVASLSASTALFGLFWYHAHHTISLRLLLLTWAIGLVAAGILALTRKWWGGAIKWVFS